MRFNLSLTSGAYSPGMWTPDEITLELARIQRRAYERVRERNAKEQLGLAFIDLPEVTTQPSNGVKENGEPTQESGH